MPKLKAAIGKLDREQILQFETQGKLEVESCTLQQGDLKVLYIWLIVIVNVNLRLRYQAALQLPFEARIFPDIYLVYFSVGHIKSRFYSCLLAVQDTQSA